MKINRMLALCLSPDQGGLELYFLKLVNYYHSINQDLSVACVKKSYIKKNVSKNIVECLSKGLFNNIYNFFLIRNYIMKKRINIIHVSWAKDIFLAIMLKLLSPGKIKVIFYRQMKISRSKKDIYHKFIYKQIDLLLVITEKLYSEACEHLPMDSSKIYKLTYGIKTPPIKSLVDKEKFFSKNNIKSNIFTIGVFSRIEEQKGQHLVLNAINKSRHKIQLCIVGHSMDDKYKDRLIRDAKDAGLDKNLKFINFVNSPMSYMPCFDLIILPTYEETFGLIVAEAMFMKVPVIGSNAGGVPEIISHGSNGLLFETKNDDDLQKKIDMIIENENERDKLVNNGYTFANDHYNHKGHFDKLETIIRTL
tara:strand:+ start:4586 stop:5677 length:1092 start_codon:yes stop_codon:yes gene_type:complete